MCIRALLSCGQQRSFRSSFLSALNSLGIDEISRQIIISRYIDIVVRTEYDYRSACILFVLLSNIITIAGVLIAGLLSIERISSISEESKVIVFWSAWVLSICLTLANKWLYSFNIHKKYVLTATLVERFKSEGWSYVAGVGKYDGVSCPDVRFRLFMTRVERLKMKSIEKITELRGTDGNPRDILGDESPRADATPNVIIVDSPRRMPIDPVNILDSSALDSGVYGGKGIAYSECKAEDIERNYAGARSEDSEIELDSLTPPSAHRVQSNLAREQRVYSESSSDESAEIGPRHSGYRTFKTGQRQETRPQSRQPTREKVSSDESYSDSGTDLAAS